jgi:hypothetical protein
MASNPIPSSYAEALLASPEAQGIEVLGEPDAPSIDDLGPEDRDENGEPIILPMGDWQ